MLDAEAVAIDRKTGKLMPFQELSRRKRKDVKVEDIQVRVCLFAFDLLYLNGEVSLVHAILLFCLANNASPSPCYANLCQRGGNSYLNISNLLKESSTLRRRQIVNQLKRSKLSLRRVWRTVVKGWWWRCWMASLAFMSLVGVVSTGWR